MKSTVRRAAAPSSARPPEVCAAKPAVASVRERVPEQRPGVAPAWGPRPGLVLAAAICLPGFGHVLAGRAQRGLGFAFFVLVGAWLTAKIAAPDSGAIGRHAAGLFVWAVSIPDAYRSAKLRALAPRAP